VVDLTPTMWWLDGTGAGQAARLNIIRKLYIGY